MKMNVKAPDASASPGKFGRPRRTRDGLGAAQDDDETNRENDTEPKRATHGLAYAIELAWATAPDGATEGDVLDVAFVTWQTELQVEEAWEEVDDGAR